MKNYLLVALLTACSAPRTGSAQAEPQSSNSSKSAIAPACPAAQSLYEIGSELPLSGELANTVALTFDDGPDDLGMTNAVLDALAAAEVHATFFVNTNTHSPLRTSGVAQATLRRMVAEGHRLGNHSATHPELGSLSTTGVAEELDEVEDAVRLTLGQKDVSLTLMRAPYGRPFNPGHRIHQDPAGFCRVAQAVAPRAVHVYWQLDPRDWEVNTKDEVLARVRALIAPQADGSLGGRGIVLLHSNQPQTAAALPEILALLREHHIQVVDLETYVQLVFGASSAQLLGR